MEHGHYMARCMPSINLCLKKEKKCWSIALQPEMTFLNLNIDVLIGGFAARATVSRSAVHHQPTGSSVDRATGTATAGSAARLPAREDLPSIRTPQPGLLPLRRLLERHPQAETAARARNQQLQVQIQSHVSLRNYLECTSKAFQVPRWPNIQIACP